MGYVGKATANIGADVGFHMANLTSQAVPSVTIVRFCDWLVIFFGSTDNGIILVRTYPCYEDKSGVSHRICGVDHVFCRCSE